MVPFDFNFILLFLAYADILCFQVCEISFPIVDQYTVCKVLKFG